MGTMRTGPTAARRGTTRRTTTGTARSRGATGTAAAPRRAALLPWRTTGMVPPAGTTPPTTPCPREPRPTPAPLATAGAGAIHTRTAARLRTGTTARPLGAVAAGTSTETTEGMIARHGGTTRPPGTGAAGAAATAAAAEAAAATVTTATRVHPTPGVEAMAGENTHTTPPRTSQPLAQAGTRVAPKEATEAARAGAPRPLVATSATTGRVTTLPAKGTPGRRRRPGRTVPRGAVAGAGPRARPPTTAPPSVGRLRRETVDHGDITR
mmetsp:Transcript_56873/g.179936  ORF Transcript_56873/g.179936 Transcript_56873/m.179936 type:complete len:267 (-) Transcript_56873:536-1336(-)